jgi:hypothetical protein
MLQKTHLSLSFDKLLPEDGMNRQGAGNTCETDNGEE